MNNSTANPSVWNKPCSDDVSTKTFSVVLSIITLAAIVGNILVTLAFLKTSTLRTSPNYFIVNMAVSDFIGAFFVWPIFATEGMLNGKGFILDPYAKPVCQLGMYTRAISQAVSVLSLVLVAVDRFVAIVFPLKATVFTRRIRTICLLLTWLIPLAFGCPYILYSRIVIVDQQTFCRFAWSGVGLPIFYLTGFLTFYLAPLIVIIILYYLIMKSLRENVNKMIQSNGSDRRQKRHKKVMRIFISIVSAFFICWTPLCVYLSLKMFYSSLFTDDKCNLLVGLFFYIFPSLSIAINPMILFLFSTNYHKAMSHQCSRAYSHFKRLLCCAFGMTSSPKEDKVY